MPPLSSFGVYAAHKAVGLKTMLGGLLDLSSRSACDETKAMQEEGSLREQSEDEISSLLSPGFFPLPYGSACGQNVAEWPGHGPSVTLRVASLASWLSYCCEGFQGGLEPRF